MHFTRYEGLAIYDSLELWHLNHSAQLYNFERKNRLTRAKFAVVVDHDP